MVQLPHPADCHVTSKTLVSEKLLSPIHLLKTRAKSKVILDFIFKETPKSDTGHNKNG